MYLRILISALFLVLGIQSVACAGLVSGFISLSGAVDSGGGDSNNPRKATVKELNEVLKSARFSLYLYFNQLEMIEYYKAPSYIPLLFDNIKTVFNIIEDTKIYVPEGKPCFDSYGNEVDGSILSPVTNSICISTERLSKKLPLQSSFAPILALIAHEYSHLLGADEKMAKELQEHVASDLVYVPYSEGVHLGSRLPYRYYLKMKDIKSALREASGHYVAGKAQESYQAIWKTGTMIDVGLSDFYIQYLNRSSITNPTNAENLMSLFSSTENNLKNSVYAKILNLMYTTCAEMTWQERADTIKRCQRQLELVYDNHNEVLVSSETFYNRQQLEKGVIYLLGSTGFDQSITVPKINSAANFAKEVAEIIAFLEWAQNKHLDRLMKLIDN